MSLPFLAVTADQSQAKGLHLTPLAGRGGGWVTGVGHEARAACAMHTGSWGGHKTRAMHAGGRVHEARAHTAQRTLGLGVAQGMLGPGPRAEDLAGVFLEAPTGRCWACGRRRPETCGKGGWERDGAHVTDGCPSVAGRREKPATQQNRRSGTFEKSDSTLSRGGFLQPGAGAGPFGPSGRRKRRCVEMQ